MKAAVRANPGVEKALSFLTSRKIFTVALVITSFLLLWLLRSRWEVASHRSRISFGQAKHGDSCLGAHIERAQQLLTMPMTQIDASSNWPAMLGNGFITAEVDGAVRIESGGKAAKAGSLRWSSRVQLKGIGYKADATFISLSSGTVRRFFRVSFSGQPSSACHVVEETLFAHRKYPELMVQHLRIENPQSQPVFGLLEPVSQELTTSYVQLKPSNLTNGFQARLVASDTDKTVLVLSTPAPQNLSATAHRQGERSMLTTHTIVEAPLPASPASSEVSSLPVEFQTAIQQAASKLKEFQAQSDLIKTHELAFSAMWPVGFEMQGFGQLQNAVAATLHVVVSSLTSALFNFDRRARNMDVAGELQEGKSHVGCYSAKPTRTLQHWQPPLNFAQVPAFVDQWVAQLREEGCFKGSPGVPSASMALQAMVFSLAGVRVVDHNTRIAPSWDIPKGATLVVSSIPFIGHRINIRLSQKEMECTRTDSLSEPIFVSGPEGHPETLKPGGTYSHRADVIYISTHHESLVEHRSSDPQQHDKPDKSRWPVWMIVLLIFLVIAFHLMLGRMLYLEYCVKM